MIETDDLKNIPRQHHQAFLTRKMSYDDWQVGNEDLDEMTEQEKEYAYQEYLGVL